MEETNTQPITSPFKKYKVAIIILAIILVVEAVWAIGFVLSSKANTQIKPVKPVVKTTTTPKIPIASVKLDPTQVSTKANAVFNMDIKIDTNKRDVNGVDAQIDCNPVLLTVVDQDTNLAGIQVKNGTIYNNLLINSVDPVKGRITLTGARLSKEAPSFTGSGVLASLVFKAKKTGQTEIKINYQEGKTNTSNITEAKTSNNILTDIQNATVQISQ